MNKIIPAIFVAMLWTCGCANGPGVPEGSPLLNSERIEARFGSYGVRIISQTETERVTCLYSGTAASPTCRTVAVVRFTSEPHPALSVPLASIRAGASLGATLREDDWTVRKINRHIGEYPLSPDCEAAVARLLRRRGPALLAVHIYELRAHRDDLDLAVATLLELHHPDYLDAADVEAIYAELDWHRLGPDELAAWRVRLADITVPVGLFD
jgi:hypothetical protein